MGRNPNKDLESDHTTLLPHPQLGGVPMGEISKRWSYTEAVEEVENNAEIMQNMQFPSPK